jgi:hypothetical protein
VNIFFRLRHAGPFTAPSRSPYFPVAGPPLSPSQSDQGPRSSFRFFFYKENSIRSASKLAVLSGRQSKTWVSRTVLAFLVLAITSYRLFFLPGGYYMPLVSRARAERTSATLCPRTRTTHWWPPPVSVPPQGGQVRAQEDPHNTEGLPLFTFAQAFILFLINLSCLALSYTRHVQHTQHTQPASSTHSTRSTHSTHSTRSTRSTRSTHSTRSTRPCGTSSSSTCPFGRSRH